MRLRKKSEALFQRALRHIPGGVNSPVRAFRAVGGHPFFVEKAEGPFLYDADGNRYIDYVCTWGPAILGHANAGIIEAVKSAVERGASFGAPHALEVRMAELLCAAVPSLKKVRMCNSGTEATMSAIRLARGFTGKNKIIKFEGCYHGHADSLLVKAGSGALTFGHPDSLGVPEDFTRHTLVLPFNQVEPLKQAFQLHAQEIAGVIVEPVPGNAGLFPPEPGFLEFLREITSQHDALLIFDEVMTGFRLGWGGAQERYGIAPDLSCFGKIIGGGLPVGAFGGSSEIMDCLAPVGGVYQAGTLSGNPLALAAGLAALEQLSNREAYRQLEERGDQLENGFNQAARSAGVQTRFQRVGSMFCAYFASEPVRNLGDAMKSDRQKFARFFHAMLDAGVYLAPSQFEAGFISTAHDTQVIDQTIEAAAQAFKQL